MYRLYSIQWKDKNPENIPFESIVFKYFRERERTKATSPGHEIKFYFFFAEQTLSVRIPKIYSLAFEDDDKASYLLMEDMSSCDIYEYGEEVSLQDNLIAVKNLAEFHAEWWNHPALFQHPDWLFRLDSDEVIEHFLEHFNRYKKNIDTQDVPSEMHQFANNYTETIPKLFQRLCGNNLSLTHGDIWINNIMFAGKESTRQLCLLDWQTCKIANPLIDFAAWIDTARAYKYENHLLSAYYDTLLRNGIRRYSFHECVADYKQAKKWSFVMHVPVLRTELGLQVNDPTSKLVRDNLIYRWKEEEQ